jgi:hypothetical protein
MPSGIRRHLTYANVVSTLCLFILLGGSAVAAQHFINGESIKPHSIPGNRLKDHTVTGRQVNLNALGKVPNAANADHLGGSPASDYRLHCPAGLQQAADICFEPTPRGYARWQDALKTCASAQLRLPSPAELALAFDHSGAPQDPEWTSTAFRDSVWNGTTNNVQQLVTIIEQNASRDIQTNYAENSSAVFFHYRCVTNATN